ncbi:MAG: hypothetical protein ABR525_05395, partial [Candidatus Limnocylindria bacterium]
AVDRGARGTARPAIYGYSVGVDGFLAYPRSAGPPTVAAHAQREHVESFGAEHVERFSANTAATGYRAVQHLFPWAVEEGEPACSAGRPQSGRGLSPSCQRCRTRSRSGI